MNRKMARAAARSYKPHMPTNPLALFDDWLAEARAAEPNDPNAMALATADATGRPSCRMVLLKDHGADGFVWYTNGESRKGCDLAANPHAALLFHWKSARRQVRLEGPVTPVSDAESDDYFHSRSRQSQLAAAASDQSRPLPTRELFTERVAALERRLDGAPVPRPAHWGGWRMAPDTIELWEDGTDRMHHRRLFTRAGDQGREGWREGLLFP